MLCWTKQYAEAIHFWVRHWLVGIAEISVDHLSCQFFDLMWAEGKEYNEKRELDPLVKSTGVVSLTSLGSNNLYRWKKSSGIWCKAFFIMPFSLLIWSPLPCFHCSFVYLFNFCLFPFCYLKEIKFLCFVLSCFEVSGLGGVFLLFFWVFVGWAFCFFLLCLRKWNDHDLNETETVGMSFSCFFFFFPFLRKNQKCHKIVLHL